MDRLSSGVIGEILSRIGDAHHLVMASETCKVWYDAFTYHVHTLSFNVNDWPVYDELLESGELQGHINNTIRSINFLRLRCLTLIMNFHRAFDSVIVTSWINGRSLRELHYNLLTDVFVNVPSVCSNENLEVLELSYSYIDGEIPNNVNFSSLRDLFLCNLAICSNYLTLLTQCPNIQNLSLEQVNIVFPIGEMHLELSSNSLKDVYINNLQGCYSLYELYIDKISYNFDSITLNAQNLERLDLKVNRFGSFFLTRPSNLKSLTFWSVEATRVDFGENAENLEVVNFRGNRIMQPRFFRKISGSRNMKKYKVWGEGFRTLRWIGYFFPHLNELSLSYDYLDPASLNNGVGYPLHHLNILEIGFSYRTHRFVESLQVILEHCTNLRKLVIYGKISTAEDPHEIGEIMSNLVNLMREHIHIEIEFDFY